MKSLEALAIRATLALSALTPACASDIAANSSPESAHATIDPTAGNISKKDAVPESTEATETTETGITKGTIHDQICQTAEDEWMKAMSSDPCELHDVDALGETENKSAKFIQEIDALLAAHLNKEGTTTKVTLESPDESSQLPLFKAIDIKTTDGRILLEYNNNYVSITQYPNNGPRKSLTIAQVGGKLTVELEDLDTANGNFKKFGPDEPCDGEITSNYLHLDYGDDFSPLVSVAGSDKRFFTYGNESLTCDTPKIIHNVCETTGEAIRITCAPQFDAMELGYDLKTEVPVDVKKADNTFYKLWGMYTDMLKKYGLDKSKPTNP